MTVTYKSSSSNDYRPNWTPLSPITIIHRGLDADCFAVTWHFVACLFAGRTFFDDTILRSEQKQVPKFSLLLPLSTIMANFLPTSWPLSCVQFPILDFESKSSSIQHVILFYLLMLTLPVQWQLTSSQNWREYLRKTAPRAMQPVTSAKQNNQIMSVSSVLFQPRILSRFISSPTIHPFIFM